MRCFNNYVLCSIDIPSHKCTYAYCIGFFINKNVLFKKCYCIIYNVTTQPVFRFTIVQLIFVSVCSLISLASFAISCKRVSPHFLKDLPTDVNILKDFFPKRKWDGDLITSCLPLKRILGIIKNVCNLPQFVKRLFCLFTLFYKLAEEYSSIIIFNRVVMST
jgi:hypothetical protein